MTIKTSLRQQLTKHLFNIYHTPVPDQNQIFRGDARRPSHGRNTRLQGSCSGHCLAPQMARALPQGQRAEHVSLIGICISDSSPHLELYHAVTARSEGYGVGVTGTSWATPQSATDWRTILASENSQSTRIFRKARLLYKCT
jgi:hypothetical protein